MNVFYKGVPNPIDVSAPGFSPEDLQVVGSNVTLKKIKPGQYEAIVAKKARGEAKITVKANEFFFHHRTFHEFQSTHL